MADEEEFAGLVAERAAAVPGVLAGGLAPSFARLGGTPPALRRAVLDVRTALVAGPDPQPGRDG